MAEGIERFLFVFLCGRLAGGLSESPLLYPYRDYSPGLPLRGI